MEQILIDLIAGAAGGNAVGKTSPKFDLGTIGNTVAGLIGGGILGQIVTLLMPAVAAAVQNGHFTIQAVIAQLVAGGAGGALLTAIVGAVKNRSKAV